MADKLSKEARSALMARVRHRDTRPEMIVRRAAHRLGYRFRLQARDLPGRPDLVFRLRRKAIFVHGCFWHGHDCPRGVRIPKVNREFWSAKLAANRARDARQLDALREEGWRALVLWECELADADRLRRRLESFLGPTRVG